MIKWTRALPSIFAHCNTGWWEGLGTRVRASQVLERTLSNDVQPSNSQPVISVHQPVIFLPADLLPAPSSQLLGDGMTLPVPAENTKPLRTTNSQMFYPFLPLEWYIMTLLIFVWEGTMCDNILCVHCLSILACYTRIL